MSRSEREKSGVTGTGMEEDKIFDEYRRAAGRIHVDDDMKQRVLGKVELRFSGTETVAYGELIKKRKSVQDAIGVQDEADGQDRIDEQDINDDRQSRVIYEFPEKAFYRRGRMVAQIERRIYKKQRRA